MKNFTLSKKHTWRGLLFLLISIPFFWVLYYALEPTTYNSSMSPKIDGNTIQLESIDGTRQNLSSFKHNIILLHFWASWCVGCMEELPSLVELKRDFASEDLEIIGINIDERPDIIIPRIIKNFKTNFPHFHDLSGKLASLLHIHGVPVTIVLDRYKNITATYRGQKEWNNPDVRAKLKCFLEGKT